MNYPPYFTAQYRRETTNCMRSVALLRRKEPGPLNGPKERQPLLRGLPLSHPHELREDEALQGEDQGAQIPRAAMTQAGWLMDDG